jgi:hypothetical protein
MKLTVNTGEGHETLGARRVFMLAGRLDWTDFTDKRHKMPIPHECEITAKERNGLYVRLDRPHSMQAGFADEVFIERDFLGHATLRVDGVVLVPDAGFTLYVAARSSGKAGQQLPSFASASSPND